MTMEAALITPPGGAQAGLRASESLCLFRERAYRGDSGRNGRQRESNSQSLLDSDRRNAGCCFSYPISFGRL